MSPDSVSVCASFGYLHASVYYEYTLFFFFFFFISHHRRLETISSSGRCIPDALWECPPTKSEVGVSGYRNTSWFEWCKSQAQIQPIRVPKVDKYHFFGGSKNWSTKKVQVGNFFWSWVSWGPIPIDSPWMRGFDRDTVILHFCFWKNRRIGPFAS